MSWLLHIARGSGVLLMAAAALKALAARETAGSLSSYYGLGEGLALAGVYGLCALELGLGLWGVVAPRRAAPVLMVLFAVFTGWHITVAFMAGGENVCPCLGKLTLLGGSGLQLALAPVLAGIAVTHFAIAARKGR